MKSFEVKNPVQLLQGSFNHEANKYRQFVPVPLEFKGRNPLDEAAFNVASSLAGEGVLLSDVDGTQRYLLLVEGEHSVRGGGLPPGNWVIGYRYSRDNGIEQSDLYLAAEVV